MKPTIITTTPTPEGGDSRSPRVAVVTLPSGQSELPTANSARVAQISTNPGNPVSAAASTEGQRSCQPVAIQVTPHTQSAVIPGAVAGESRLGRKVDPDALRSLAPDASQTVLTAAAAMLAEAPLNDAPDSAWLSYGLAEQMLASEMASQRLTLAQSSPARAVTAHLDRLRSILENVLAAMQPGLLRRRSPIEVWRDHSSEIEQIETILKDGVDQLRAVIRSSEQQQRSTVHTDDRLRAADIAGQYLLEKEALPEAARLSITDRLLALVRSRALVQEQRAQIELDIDPIRDLLMLVQDSVLIQLPAVRSQLTALQQRDDLRGKHNDTDRFLITEVITDLLQPILNRKTSWPS